MNVINASNAPMLKSAGSETTNAKSSFRMPFAACKSGGGEKFHKQQQQQRKAHLNQAQYPSNPKDTNNTKQSRGNGQVNHDVLHENAKNGCKHKTKVENIPRYGKVVKSKTCGKLMAWIIIHATLIARALKRLIYQLF